MVGGDPIPYLRMQAKIYSRYTVTLILEIIVYA